MICDDVLSVIDLNNSYNLDSVFCSGQLTLQYCFRLLNSVLMIFSCTVICKVDYMGCTPRTHHNVLCNVCSQGSSMSISVHLKFSLSDRQLEHWILRHF